MDETAGMPTARTIEDRDPSTGQLLAEIPCASAEEVAAAVARARAAAQAWADLPVDDRCACLERASERLLAAAPELGRLASQEMGKPLATAVGEVEGYARYLHEELAEVKLAVAPTPFESEAADVVLHREPLGVVAAITPWNFPVAMPLQILVPALATGNAVVLKPSEHVPLTGRMLAEVLQAELPDGVLELVEGDGATGADLVAADIDMVGFVGSRATGEAIMRSAATGLKRLVLELGGKDPMLVFADADLPAAARAAVQHSLRNTGQVCCSVERVLVEDAARETFEQLVLEEARQWTFGDPAAEGTRMGPLVSTAQRERVVAQVEDARVRGARILLGGELPEGDGAYYPATVVADAPEDAAMVREETFGPVVCLETFPTEAEGVRRANDTPYGLGANVWTGDADRARRVARALRAGQVGVNRYLGGAQGTPWVGARQSGFGYLGGIEGHRQFTVPKTIATARPGA